MTAILICWALWAAFNVVLLACTPYLLENKATGPFTNGFKIVVPPGVAEKVTPEEMEALLCHERGHIAHRHNVFNLMRSCLLIPRSARLHQRQELEADDYAAVRGHAKALASALYKLSANDFDWYRAARLRKLYP